VSKEQYSVHLRHRPHRGRSLVGGRRARSGRPAASAADACRFRTRVVPAEMAFTFWLVDIHTDPDEVPQELDALADVFRAMQTARPDEDDRDSAR